MSNRRAARALGSLQRIARRYGPGLAAHKLVLLQVLARARLKTAGQVRKLHELLCFLDAYPDSQRVRGQVRRMLKAFSRRPDLIRNRRHLSGSGIAGTDIPYRFFWPTARWITGQWPGALVLDRRDRIAIHDILAVLPGLLGPAQSSLPARHARNLGPVDRLVPRGMTDAEFIIGLIAAMPGDEFSREAFGDRLDLSYVLRAGRGTPERTTMRFDVGAVHFQTADFHPVRPDLRLEARRGPRRISALPRRAAESLIRLSRVSMITRERDLAAFQFASPDDVFLAEDDAGLAFAMMGTTPARRAVLPATYAALTLKNGVPIGYVQVDVLGRHAALHFNTFETFRGAEAARVFARLVATVRHVFGCDEFSVEPYQLGAGNEEGIATGAWWFYHRLGFRPRAPQARRIAARESARRSASPRYRSSPGTLRRLSRWHLFYSLDRDHQARLPRSQRWLDAAAIVTRRYSRSKSQAPRDAFTTAALTRLGRRSPRLTAVQRTMLCRWAPLALALTAKGRWSASERTALLRIILAKAAPGERGFQRQLLRHRRLRALLDC